MDKETLQMMADNLRRTKMTVTERQTLVTAAMKGLTEAELAEIINTEMTTRERSDFIKEIVR